MNADKKISKTKRNFFNREITTGNITFIGTIIAAIIMGFCTLLSSNNAKIVLNKIDTILPSELEYKIEFIDHQVKLKNCDKNHPLHVTTRFKIKGLKGIDLADKRIHLIQQALKTSYPNLDTRPFLSENNVNTKEIDSGIISFNYCSGIDFYTTVKAGFITVDNACKIRKSNLVTISFNARNYSHLMKK